MAIESKEWVYASKRVRKGQSGGIHVYIDSNTLGYALQNVNISPNSRLMIKRYPLTGSGKTAKILISIREVENNEKT